jgi:hypothetical protein
MGSRGQPGPGNFMAKRPEKILFIYPTFTIFLTLALKLKVFLKNVK